MTKHFFDQIIFYQFFYTQKKTIFFYQKFLTKKKFFWIYEKNVYRRLDLSSSISYQTRILDIFFHIQDTGDRAQETGHRRQDTGDRTQETGHRRQDTGDKTQNTGHRIHSVY